MSLSSFNKLKSHLREMFHYDDNDLDFGVFKLLKLKKKEIEEFIDGDSEKSLKQIVEEALSEVTQEQAITNKLILENFISEKGGPDEQGLLDNITSNYQQIVQFINYKNPDNKVEILEVLEKLSSQAGSKVESDLEDKIYNYILNFFENYYNNGDFGYNSKSVSEYKVHYDSDYNGSDKLFHWKNKGNIYIKTAEGFNNLKFNIDDKIIEFRLESKGEESELAHNNNKTDKAKHYQFEKIMKVDGVYRIIFSISKKSTPKDVIYKSILTDIFNKDEDVDLYLYKNDKKQSLIFNNLEGQYNEIQNGQVKGLSKLQISKDKYLSELIKHEKFKPLGSNNDKRKEALEDDSLVKLIYKLDLNLNKFYVGNDSDYFVHHDLKGFLTKEKEKYIKNIIFSDLSHIFDVNQDNTTIIIAKAFNNVVEEIIDFLNAIETFQKNIFTMKKKVLSTNYVISLDKIPSDLYEDILKEKLVVEEFRTVHNKSIQSISDIEANSNLTIDTNLIQNDKLKRKVISSIHNIDENTNALLIKSENYQGLNLLRNKYYQQVKCIYIDPPYNTGGDFLYKDNFKHSTWLSFMESRLLLAKDLLDKDGSIFISIDDEEAFNLKLLMDDIFGEDAFVGSIAYERSGSAGLGQGGSIVNTKEYILFYSLNKSKLNFVGHDRPLEKDTMKRYNKVLVDEGEKELVKEFNAKSNDLPVRIYKHTGHEFKTISLRSFETRKKEIEKDFVDNFDNVFRTFLVQKENEFQHYLISNMDKNNLYSVEYIPSRGKHSGQEITNYYFNNELFAWLKDSAFLDGDKIIKTNKITDLWAHSDIPKADLFNEGKVTLPRGKKPEHLIYRLIKLATNEGDLVLDFFAGSGTTAATAVKMQRKSIAIEMGEYFEEKTLTRMKHVLSGDSTGISAKVDWAGSGIVKYHDLEQYEDILDNLNEYTEKTEIPNNLPRKYLFRPEANYIRGNFDISKPFTNMYIHGKSNVKRHIDFIETYCYLKGYSIEKIDYIEIEAKLYAVIKTGSKLLIFREVELGEDDSENIKTIVSGYENIDQLEVNFDIDLRRINIDAKVISNSDLDEGLLWS